jgi:hypothetical protein
MSYIIPQDRHQLSFGSLADGSGGDGVLQFIDAFLDKPDLAQPGFVLKAESAIGRPAYRPYTPAAILLCGYI